MKNIFYIDSKDKIKCIFSDKSYFIDKRELQKRLNQGLKAGVTVWVGQWQDGFEKTCINFGVLYCKGCEKNSRLICLGE